MTNSICDEQRIKRFLQDELSASDQQQFEHHIEQCETCRSSLHDSTAEGRWWDEAGRYLCDEDDDLEPVSSFVTVEDHEENNLKRTSAAAHAAGQIVKLLAPTDDPRMLGRFGGYEIAGVIGAGGMSIVLKGFDASLNRYVAIKVLAPQLATSGAARKRFAREAQAAAAVVHENVIAIHCVDESEGLPYLIMPYERGSSLQTRLDQSGPLELKEILRIGMQSAAGLAAAHAQGLVHRDVKPANILLADGVERVTLTDFGLARAVDDASLTRTGMIAGTPQYMSPEQARGEGLDHRSDLFSLGSVIYTMCTGRPPFRAESSYGVLWRITDSRPTPIREINPDMPPWMCTLISKLHAKDPDERYQSAAEVAHRLGRCLAHVQQPMRVTLPDELVPKDQGPRRGGLNPVWAGILTAALLFAVLIGVVLTLVGPASEERSKDGRSSADAVDLDTESSLAVEPDEQDAELQWYDEATWLLDAAEIETNSLELQTIEHLEGELDTLFHEEQ